MLPSVAGLSLLVTGLSTAGVGFAALVVGFGSGLAGGSIEATARARYIHPNTVRYRLRRIQEVTGYSATDPRDAYVLRLALTLGRLLA